MTIEESQAENEQLKKDLEHARSYKRRIKMRSRNLQAENERLKGEVRKWKRDSAITSAMFRLVVQGKECTSTKVLEDAERVENLEKENAKLKRELQQSATNCNKLKCLALHGMFGYACAKMNALVEKPDYKFGSGKIYKDFSRWHRLCRLWLKAYRKAKKELKEGK